MPRNIRNLLLLLMVLMPVFLMFCTGQTKNKPKAGPAKKKQNIQLHSAYTAEKHPDLVGVDLPIPIITPESRKWGYISASALAEFIDKNNGRLYVPESEFLGLTDFKYDYAGSFDPVTGIAIAGRYNKPYAALIGPDLKPVFETDKNAVIMKCGAKHFTIGIYDDSNVNVLLVDSSGNIVGEFPGFSRDIVTDKYLLLSKPDGQERKRICYDLVNGKTIDIPESLDQSRFKGIQEFKKVQLLAAGYDLELDGLTGEFLLPIDGAKSPEKFEFADIAAGYLVLGKEELYGEKMQIAAPTGEVYRTELYDHIEDAGAGYLAVGVLGDRPTEAERSLIKKGRGMKAVFAGGERLTDYLYFSIDHLFDGQFYVEDEKGFYILDTNTGGRVMRSSFPEGRLDFISHGSAADSVVRVAVQGENYIYITKDSWMVNAKIERIGGMTVYAKTAGDLYLPVFTPGAGQSGHGGQSDQSGHADMADLADLAGRLNSIVGERQQNLDKNIENGYKYSKWHTGYVLNEHGGFISLELFSNKDEEGADRIQTDVIRRNFDIENRGLLVKLSDILIPSGLDGISDFAGLPAEVVEILKTRPDEIGFMFDISGAISLLYKDQYLEILPEDMDGVIKPEIIRRLFPK